ncbi:MAG: DivIVA domain-containing protein [Syntrophobacteraceae bacterium]
MSTDWNTVDIQHKRFKKRWMGFDHEEVEIFLDQVAEEVQHLKAENAALLRDLQQHEKDLKEYKDREKTIRNVLLTAHNTAETIKSNAEKEAKLIVGDAELKAEKTLQTAHNRLAQLHEDINELKRQRIQMESKLRSTIEAYLQLLGMNKEEEEDANKQRTA